MGILSGLLGNASDYDPSKANKEYDALLADGERVEKAYKVLRDAFLFTNIRLIIVDKQGLTGKKVSYHAIPYKSITHYAIETLGHFDLNAELKIWISSASQPVEKTFQKDSNVYDVQKTLTQYLMK